MRVYFIVAIAFVASAVATSAPAAEVLDQSNDTSPSAFADSTSGSYQEQAQSFTVSVNGTLSRIAVQIVFPGFGVGGSAILTVYGTSGGVPNASLGTASLSSSGMPSVGYAYQSFDVSSYAIPVHVGDVLAYGVTSTTGSFISFCEARATTAHTRVVGGIWHVRNPTGAWSAYNPTRDLGFQTYVLAAAAGLPGDFNNDSKVDASDYVTWRKYNNTSHALANDDGLGVPVGTAHYTLWAANFGKPPGSGSGLDGSAVPEPATLLLTLATCGCLCGFARRKF